MDTISILGTKYRVYRDEQKTNLGYGYQFYAYIGGAYLFVGSGFFNTKNKTAALLEFKRGSEEEEV